MHIFALSGSFSSPFIGASPQFIARKCATIKKSANFVAKVPVKRRKTGSFSAKAAYLRTPLGFPPSGFPFHGLIRPRFLRPRSHACAISRPSTCRCGRYFPSRLTLPRKMLLPFPLRRDVHLELHAPMPEGIPFTDGNRGRTQRMIEKQSGKCHIENARTRKAIRTTETAAQTLHGFLRNAEGRARND